MKYDFNVIITSQDVNLNSKNENIWQKDFLGYWYLTNKEGQVVKIRKERV